MARDAFGVTPGRDHTCTAFCCCEGGARRASPFEAEDLRKQRPFPLHGERRPGARPRAAPPMAPEVWVSAPAASAKNFAELQDMHDRARRASAAQAFEEARGAGVFGLSSVQTMHGVGTQLGDDERHALLHSRHFHHPESDGGLALDGGGASLARAPGSPFDPDSDMLRPRRARGGSLLDGLDLAGGARGPEAGPSEKPLPGPPATDRAPAAGPAGADGAGATEFRTLAELNTYLAREAPPAGPLVRRAPAAFASAELARGGGGGAARDEPQRAMARAARRARRAALPAAGAVDARAEAGAQARLEDLQFFLGVLEGQAARARADAEAAAELLEQLRAAMPGAAPAPSAAPGGCAGTDSFAEARGAGVFGLSSVQTMHGVGTQLGDDERHALLHSRHLHHPESDGGGDSALDGQAGGASLARALFGEEPPSGVLFGCDVLKENCGCCLELEEMISLKCAPAPAAQHGAPCRAAWCAGHSRDALQDGPENSSGHARAGTSRQPRRSSAAA
jgi:hypothetical protein